MHRHNKVHKLKVYIKTHRNFFSLSKVKLLQLPKTCQGRTFTSLTLNGHKTFPLTLNTNELDAEKKTKEIKPKTN